MKSFSAALLMMVLSAPAFAVDLLRCNPPMGSGIQEIKITQKGDQIVATELAFDGARSGQMKISSVAWRNKDIQLNTKTDGLVHLYQLKQDGFTVWAYEAHRRGVVGNCHR